MPLRGSAQFLLPFSRHKAGRWAVLGASAVALLTGAGVIFSDLLPLVKGDPVAQVLRENVWEQALSGRAEPVHWPWEDTSATVPPTPAAKVPRLGLSAAVVTGVPVATEHSLRPTMRHAEYIGCHEPHGDGGDANTHGDVVLSDVEVGDQIRFAAANGAVCIYQVTGHRALDPHLDDSEAPRLDLNDGVDVLPQAQTPAALEQRKL